MNDSLLELILQDARVAGPMLAWPALGLLLLVIQMIVPKPRLALGTSLLGMLSILVYSIAQFDSSLSSPLFVGTVVWDVSAQIINLLSQIIVLGVLLMTVPGCFGSSNLFKDSYEQLPEFLMCLIFSGFGAAVLGSAKDLTSLFLGLEILSIGIYCLCGFFRKEISSTESAFKYLLIGGFSTVLFLYGVAFVYGASGSTQFDQIFANLGNAPNVLTWFGIVFLVAGFAFKLAFVPFHLYTADVYEGAPTPVTAYMATILKVGAAGAALRVFWGFLSSFSGEWTPLWLGLCLLSILIGSLAALQQKTFKRLLAFSSISHAGFIGLAVLAARPVSGDLFPLMAYLIIYSVMSLGSFAVISLLEERGKPFLLEDLKGLGQNKTWIAVALAVFLLGLAGIPPFAGFMIKFWVLQSLVEQQLWGTAIVAVVGSVIGAAYYLKLLIYMFVSKEEGGAVQWMGLGDRLLTLRLVIGAAALITVIGGLWPRIYADWILTSLALK